MLTYFTSTIIFFYLFYLAKSDKLLAVTTLVRHGERLGSYQGYDPNDPYLDIRMANPSDELLNLGVQELYNVGLWMRKHYSNFLPLKYRVEDIYVQSIDFDRCLMSAEALLAALYPPIGEEIWNQNLLWQPVPIHSTAVSYDVLLQWTACPYFQMQSKKALELKNKISEENSDFFKYLKENTGSPVNIDDALLIYNILEGEKLINLTLPLWAHGVIRNIKPLVEISFVIDTLDKRLRALRAGPMIHRVLTQFERAISGYKFGTRGSDYRKMMLYSSADMPIYYLADGLGLENIGIVTYGFSLYLELRESDDGRYFVDFFYKNSTDLDAPAHRVKMKGFPDSVNFDDFKESAGQVGVNTTEWMSLCKNLLGKTKND